MYNHFFGFKERPFKLVPDPDYLFLSQSHEEALAHLKYAVLSGEGFVEIIGEVGTGKTMLCRAFLENMGSDVETAYIFNPKMDAQQLLMAINAEFGIPSGHGTIKALIDELNAFLMEKKGEGRKAILLIDEAQNLSRSVLEQIRLLTNLETTRDKLLQIILVGQPELGELLDSHELRQLGQRITLSCRLRPLTMKETASYINHRLHVAACAQPKIFTKAAIRRIQRYCRGVPRLINIACDRSLLSAYGYNQRRVSARIAESAIRELSSRGDIRQSALTAGRKRILAFFAAALVFVAFLFYHSDIRAFFGYLNHRQGAAKNDHAGKSAPNTPGKEKPAPNRSPGEDQREKTSAGAALSPEPNRAKIEKPETGVSEEAVKPKETLAHGSLIDLLKARGHENSRSRAVKTVISRWRSDPSVAKAFESIEKTDVFIELSTRLNGLYAHRVDGDLGLIRKLNLPAILEMDSPETHRPVYLAVIGAGEKTFTLNAGADGQSITVPSRKILEHWKGVAYVLWENFYKYRGTIPLNSPGDSVITLKMHLREVGFTDLELNAAYDEDTRSAVRAIQARHGIPVDGYVGPLTKMVLYNEKPSLSIPHLDQAPRGMDDGARASSRTFPTDRSAADVNADMEALPYEYGTKAKPDKGDEGAGR